MEKRTYAQELAKRMAESEYLAAAKRRFRAQAGDTVELKEAQGQVARAATKMRRAFGSDADRVMLDLSRRAMHERDVPVVKEEE